MPLPLNLNLRRESAFRNRGACSPQPTASTNSKCSPALQPAALSSRSPALLQPEDLSRGTQVQYGTLEAQGAWVGSCGGGGVNQGRRRRLLVPVRVCGACACAPPLLLPQRSLRRIEPCSGGVGSDAYTEREHTRTHTHTRRGVIEVGDGVGGWMGLGGRQATYRNLPTGLSTYLQDVQLTYKTLNLHTRLSTHLQDYQLNYKT